MSDLSFWSMDFGFEFLFLDLGFYDLDLRFVNIDVGYCPAEIVSLDFWSAFQGLWCCNLSFLSR